MDCPELWQVSLAHALGLAPLDDPLPVLQAVLYQPVHYRAAPLRALAALVAQAQAD
jgi:hypothetical protein